MSIRLRIKKITAQEVVEQNPNPLAKMLYSILETAGIHSSFVKDDKQTLIFEILDQHIADKDLEEMIKLIKKYAKNVKRWRLTCSGEKWYFMAIYSNQNLTLQQQV